MPRPLTELLPEPSPQDLRMPGSTLATRLKVYESVGPDGQRGGTPHVHLACTELYFVTAGSGSVEMINASGFSTIELKQNDVLVFTPGTLHRLINPNSDLELFIVMQNSGLPERGDNVVTFRPEILSDDLRYHRAMTAPTVEDAAKRRDEGVLGFLEVKAAFEKSRDAGLAALEELYTQAARRTRSQHPLWYSTVANGAFTEAQTALQRILDLGQGNVNHMFTAQHAYIPAKPFSAVGFCGHLNRYFDPATLFVMEGVAKA